MIDEQSEAQIYYVSQLVSSGATAAAEGSCWGWELQHCEAWVWGAPGIPSLELGVVPSV